MPYIFDMWQWWVKSSDQTSLKTYPKPNLSLSNPNLWVGHKPAAGMRHNSAGEPAPFLVCNTIFPPWIVVSFSAKYYGQLWQSAGNPKQWLLVQHLWIRCHPEESGKVHVAPSERPQYLLHHHLGLTLRRQWKLKLGNIKHHVPLAWDGNTFIKLQLINF